MFSQILRFFTYYASVTSTIFSGTSVIINPNDPLEARGPLAFERIQEIITVVGEESTAIHAELYRPLPTQATTAFVLFLPGYGTSYTLYQDYYEHLASHGFLAVGMDFAGFILAAERQHEKKAYEALDIIAHVRSKYPEYNNLPIYMAGYSEGGKIAYYAASLQRGDKRRSNISDVAGVIALDPGNAGGGPCFVQPLFESECRLDPVAPNAVSGQRGTIRNLANGTKSLIMRSNPDPFSNPTGDEFNAANFFFGLDGKGLDAAPSPVWYFDFGMLAPHTMFLPGIASQQVQIVKRTMIAFLMLQESGNIDQNIAGDLEGYLTGDIIQKDISANLLVSVQYR